MKLSTKSMAITLGLLWGGAVLTTGVVNLIRPTYGRRFLRVVGSVYPGYHAQPKISDVAVGTAYALLDGFVGGAIFAALYNQVDASTNH